MAADAADEVPDQRDRESRKQDQALDSLTDVVCGNVFAAVCGKGCICGAHRPSHILAIAHQVEEVEFDAGKVQKAMAELMASQKASMEEQRQR